MKFSQTLIWINCWLFVTFGVGFALAPELLAGFITGASPSTPSGIIDMGATYGGMALGLAFIFARCAKTEKLVPHGIQGVFAVMIALTTTRLLGIFLNGSPNMLIISLLMAEGLMAGLAFFAMRKTPVE